MRISPPPASRGAPDGDPLDRTPITRLRGVGPRIEARLKKLGIETLSDLLFHLPLRYQDRSRIQAIGTLYAGCEAQIQGRVTESRIARGGRRSLWLQVADATGSLVVRFFHFNPNRMAWLQPGTRLRCFGTVRLGLRSLEMIHPEYQVLTGGPGDPPLDTRLTPIYPTTEGLYQSTWRTLLDQALQRREACPLEELLPEALLEPLGLPTLNDALVFLHRPPVSTNPAHLQDGHTPAHHRLALEELVAHQLGLRRLRKHWRAAAAPNLAGAGHLRARLLAQLPFSLTRAQERVLQEIAEDLGETRPMLRLLQGDVGAGKTIVAVLSALQAVEAGYQVGLMAPTELLSEQHFRTLQNWLAPLDLQVTWLTGRHRGRDRRERLAAIASGTSPLAVGTHALFQRDVTFRNLGLAIIDEQHRFGVHQRLQLREKGRDQGRLPHQLILTATPIPRSLAMTSYADLDLSILDELPPGRTPIITVAVPDERRETVIERVRAACLQGRQAYWVCTLIEESELLQCQAAEKTAATLREAMPEVRIGLAHGRLSGPEREAVMAAFRAGDLDLLVATTVIEVGVDVPNASLMVIENPERLGLAQLHQLRGRIGRGAVQSHCVLLYHAPLSHQARTRIDLLRHTDDGFRIAEQDLRMRGPGEVLGTRQAGVLQFRIADPSVHGDLLSPARAIADRLIEDGGEKRIAGLIARWLGGRETLAGV